MRLTELFTGEKQISDAGKTQQNIGKTDVVNRQIRSMVPGQTIQGEVISKNGGEVQIRLSEDLMLQAKLDRNMNLEVGKSMTFEVKKNGKLLVLSPLFTNVASDANVLKALDMASLPINGATVSITKQLMEAGLSIDRNTLQQVYRESNLFPQAQASDIINLHKMQMPVNQSNVSQIVSYRNLSHQLVTGMNNVLDALPDMFTQMMESGDTEGAVKLYQQLTLLAREGAAAESVIARNIPKEGNVLPNILSDEIIQQSKVAGNNGIEQLSAEIKNEQNSVIQDDSLSGSTAQGNVLQETVTQAVTQAAELLPEELMTDQNVVPDATAEESKAFDQRNLNVQENLPIGSSETFEAKSQSSQQLQELLMKLPTDLSEKNILAGLKQMVREGGGNKFLEPVLQLLKQQWTIAPEQVADAEQVEKLYRRLDKQIKGLAQIMEGVGQTGMPAHSAATNLVQNLDFLQQMNQLYTYIQLPLRLQNGEAHGDLYVYSNKKHLAEKNGQISALLHLDMEHLGPVDVYVSMMNEKVNTRFYLQDEEMLDFLMVHMDRLTQRLQKRGYQCSLEMQVRELGEEQKNVIQKLLEQENHVPMAEYAFDVRT